MLRALIVSRRGFIEIGQVSDDVNQCMNRGDRELDYTVEITADPDALDAQGFIIDRHHIHAYFQRKYGSFVPVLPSCEVMASEACVQLAKIVGEQRCKKVVASVGGVLAVWERPPQVQS